MVDTKLTEEEQQKALILITAIEGKITNARAGKQLQLSVRQAQRAKAAIRIDGMSSMEEEKNS